MKGRARAAARLLACLACICVAAGFHAAAQVTPAWLTRVNLYRATASLPPLTEDPAYSDGASKHARYIVKTDTLTHNEDPASAWYTPEGASAAAASDIAASGSTTATEAWAIDLWMQAPFHAVGILDPRLRKSGFGLYREADGGYQSGAALDVIRGRVSTLPTGITFPILWPGNGSSVPVTSYRNESPNPLTSCPGYASPAGLPILVQLGTGSIMPNVTASSFGANGVALEHCVFHEGTYTNPDPSQQSLARSILGARDAIVLIPRAPLTQGVKYDVSITANGTVLRWSFSVNPAATCSYGVSPTALAGPAEGGPGSVTVTTPNDCAWGATSGASWISVPSAAGGSGPGSVNFSVAPNTQTTSRTGTISVAGQTVTVTQAAAPAPPPSCTYSVSPASASVAATGASGTVSVTTTSGCGWTAVSGASWISVTGGASRSGSGTVGYGVAANTASTARTGSLTIAGRPVTVTQAAAPTAPVAPVASFSDDFTRASDSTVLGSGWVEVLGDLKIAGGVLTNAVQNTYHIALVPPAGATVTAAADFAFSQHQGTPRFGIVLRYQDPKNYYLLYRQSGGTSVLRISRFVNGVETILKSGALANPAKDVHFRLEGSAAGSTLTLKLNGIVKLSVDDTRFTTGRVGLLMGSTLSHVHRADNVTASAR